MDPAASLESLCRLFHPALRDVGDFEPRARGSLPAPYGRLLDHQHHMTVTMEEFHGGPVDVQVLDTRREPAWYAREILLRRRRDAVVVQYGIMRLDWGRLGNEVRAAIEAAATPLGHVLIRNDVLRQIHLDQLWRVRPASPLRDWLGAPPDTETYGRSARIDVDGAAAVELLEIVAPPMPK